MEDASRAFISRIAIISRWKLFSSSKIICQNNKFPELILIASQNELFKIDSPFLLKSSKNAHDETDEITFEIGYFHFLAAPPPTLCTVI